MFGKYRLENTRVTHVRISDAGSSQMGHTAHAAALSLQWPKGCCLTRADSLCIAGNALLTDTSTSILYTMLSLNQRANKLFSFIWMLTAEFISSWVWILQMPWDSWLLKLIWTSYADKFLLAAQIFYLQFLVVENTYLFLFFPPPVFRLSNLSFREIMKTH